MTSEELERTIKFIIDRDAELIAKIERLTANIDALVALQAQSEAQFAAKFGRLLDNQAKSYARLWSHLDEPQAKQTGSDWHTERFEESLTMLAELARRSKEKALLADERSRMPIGPIAWRNYQLQASEKHIADLRKALAESELRVTRKIEALAVAQKDTDSHLKAFVEVVERYINEGRNGKASI